MGLDNRTTIQITEKLRQELKVLAAARDCSYQQLLSEMISVFRELDKEKTIVSIPNKLAKKVEGTLEKTDMKSTSEYITFLLRMALSENDNFTVEDENRIRQRLKKLEYL